MANFERDGIRFLYPESWTIETQDAESGWTVSLQSPDTAFFLLSLDGDMPEPDYMVQTALDALRGEYPELEADAAVDAVAGQPAVGFDVQFFSFDLTNSCWLRSFLGGTGTALAMWQANDLELERNEPILRAIIASIKIEED